jgi:hypothetical protein
MSNHFHVVLRVRPDLAQGCSDAEVALRWRLLYPPRDEVTGLQTKPEQVDLNIITSDPARVDELRHRLASLPWFMRCLNEHIARAANREDHCSGRFWQGRFRSVALLDGAAALACSVYVDLNPIRAGVAGTPEESEFTLAFDPIRSLPASSSDSTRDGKSSLDEPALKSSIERISPAESARPDAWLCELTLNESASELPDAARLPEQVAAPVVAANDGEAEVAAGPCGLRPTLARPGHRIEAICRSSLRSTCRCWTVRGVSCGREVAGRFLLAFRRSWTGWVLTVSAGLRRCCILAAGSSARQADATRWQPGRCAVVVAGSRVNGPRRLLFSDC